MAGTWSVTKIKIAGPESNWPAYRLGTDAHGTWLFVPAGTVRHTEDGEVSDTAPMDGVQLIPADETWVGSWSADGSIMVEVTTSVELGPTSVRYEVLGLEAWATDDDHELIDVEYEVARAAGLIRDEQDGPARATAERLARRLAQRVEPFGGKGWEWLGRVRRNELHVITYDPSWPSRFAEARDEMLPALPAGTRVEHFGSTSVPGLAAKDCIDIAVVVRRDRFGEAIAGLEAVGYEARPNAFDDPEHLFFRRLDTGRRTHHVHLFDQDHPNLVEVLAFRDLLRADPEARRRYQAVKLGLTEANPYDRSGYLAGKTAVVRDLLEVALARRSESG